MAGVHALGTSPPHSVHSPHGRNTDLVPSARWIGERHAPASASQQPCRRGLPPASSVPTVTHGGIWRAEGVHPRSIPASVCDGSTLSVPASLREGDAPRPSFPPHFFLIYVSGVGI